MKYVNAFMFFVSIAAAMFFAISFSCELMEIRNSLAYGLIALIAAIVFGADAFMLEENEQKGK